ncbi:hypothetical protein FF2_016779 [Malus domestica]
MDAQLAQQTWELENNITPMDTPPSVAKPKADPKAEGRPEGRRHILLRRGSAGQVPAGEALGQRPPLLQAR